MGVSEPGTDPELTLTVFGNRLKRKRSELVEKYDLAGLDDERIIKLAQKELAADQRLAEARRRYTSASKTEAPEVPARAVNLI